MNEKGVFLLTLFTASPPEIQVGIMKRSALYETAWYSANNEWESEYSRNTTAWD